MNGELANSRPAEVLLVEDNEQDVVLTREGFKRAKFMVNLHHVEDGEECLAFLRKQGKFAAAPTPDLILLDINLPVMDGREVMAEIVRDPALRHLPVVVLTTSSAETDILDMYKLRCSSYITKPVDFEQFQKLVTQMGNYWFTLVVLPPIAEPS
ncbi:MAG TPA: response regulator [Fibrobacteria bacterium]|nr:response regulator [Fibrobacteria bacterium]